MSTIVLTDEIVEAAVPQGRQQELFDAGFALPGSFGVRLGAGGRKSFFLVYSVDGKRQRYPVGVFPLLKIDEARLRAEEVLRQVQDGRNPAWELRIKKRLPTLAQFCQEFLNSDVQRKLSAATRKEYSRIISASITPLLGQKKISDIRVSDAELLYAQIGVQRGSKTMGERSCSLLKTILGFAVRQGHLAASPIGGWKPPVTKTVTERSDPFRLPFPDLLRLWVLLGEEDPLVAGPFRMILLTGQRPSQVLGMKWSQIRGELWYWPRGTAASPSVPFYLTPPALQCLKSIQEQLRKHRLGSSPFVFPSRDGGPKKHLRKTAFRLSKKLGFRRPFSPLALRNAVRENLYELGVRPDVVERILYPHVPLPGRRGPLDTNSYNYASEVQDALLAWSKRLTTVTSIKPFSSAPNAKGASKIVPLFPGGRPLHEPPE